MVDHDSPISLSPSGGSTLAKSIVSGQADEHWNLPEGTILASGVRRGTSLVIDIVIVTTVLMLATGWELLHVWILETWRTSPQHSLAYTFVLLASHWLYWRVTGLWYSRSFGQKMMGLAIVCTDGSAVTSEMWDRRAFWKLVYLVPLVNALVGVYEVARIFQRHTHQTNLDLKVGTIVAHANSLPPGIRKHIR
jgi:hypothetical protein